jgi:TonB family protein
MMKSCVPTSTKMIPVMNTAVTRNDWVGRLVDGRFPLLEWLGSSEQAGVFRTELKGPSAGRAAIRLVPADKNDSEARLRDWRAAAALSHPHLMRIFDSGRAQVGGVDLLYVVTEYAEESLAEVIPERPLSTIEAREMLGPILGALSYLHANGLVHGHIKPSNILVVDDRLKLPAECVRSAVTFTPRPELAIYDAPELASGTISPAADMWSLGMTLAEALAQRPPLWDRSWKRDPEVPADIPPPFADIARACLRCDPARRAAPREIENRLSGTHPLEEPANEFDQSAPANISTRAPSSSGIRIGAIAAGVIVIALIGFLVLRSHKPPPSTAPSSRPSTPAVIQSSPPPPSAPSTVSGAAAQKGAVERRVMPDVLESANRTIRGKIVVRIRLDVNANGDVSDAQFDARGSSRYFSRKALDAARKWTFKPAQVNGRAASSVWVLRFEFRRSGPDVTAKEVSP